MFVYVHVYKYTCIFVYAHYLNIYICIYIYIYTHTYMYTDHIQHNSWARYDFIHSCPPPSEPLLEAAGDHKGLL